MVLKKIAVILGVIVFLCIAAGCSGKGGGNGQQPPGSERVQDDTPEGIGVEQNSGEEQNGPVMLSQGLEMTEVVVYLGNNDGYLVPVKREVPKVEGIARAAVLELIRGPGSSSTLERTIPEGTKLRDINIKDNGLAVVDFSSEFKSEHWGGSAGESLTVYSVVNTLTQFSSVKEVQILVEGNKLETLAGHITLDQPIERENAIIQASGD